jgi:mannose-6-phosphate isomerase-like protein (cupin superfamily)
MVYATIDLIRDCDRWRGAWPGRWDDAAHVHRFREEGFVGPLRLDGEELWPDLRRRLSQRRHPPPAGWAKGRAVTDPLVYWVATRPELIDLLTRLLGEDVVLWGASMVRRRPGQKHPWHTDIESSARSGGFASVWLGLEGTSRASGLQVIRGSHRMGRTFQEVAQEHGCRRGEASAEGALRWAKSIDPAAELIQPEIADGEALVFDGRLWHGSDNASGVTRSALLLQYARADVPIRLPDFRRLEWPFRFLESPRPPVIVVHGRASGDVNRVVPPPRVESGPMISTGVHALSLPLGEDPRRGWKPYPIFKGATRLVERMSCHASVLSAGVSPHPPHVHPEEELLIVLDGEAEIILADDEQGTNVRQKRLAAGCFSYYPAGQPHTIRNPGAVPVTYLMFKWTATPASESGTLRASVFDSRTADPVMRTNGFGTARLFEGSTSYLRTLHSHVSVVAPGGGYGSHVDAHDVALVVLSGRIETLGRVVRPFGVVYCSAGAPHDVHNPGEEPARYLVFEFHSPGTRPADGRRFGSLRRRFRYLIAGLHGRARAVARAAADRLLERQAEGGSA